MDQRREMAKLTQEILLEFIQPVQLLTLELDQGTGAVTGRFRSGPLLFEYSIKGDKVSYGPMGGTQKGAGRAGKADQGKAVAPAPPARGDAADELQQLPIERYDAVETLGQEQWVRRGIAYLAALHDQTSERIDTYLASELRMDGPGQKRCAVGYQCGGTCIARSKLCLVEVRKKGVSKRLAELTASEKGAGADPGDLKHVKLKAERVAMGKQLISRLEQQRADGQGTLMEFPDAQALALIDDVENKRKEIDRKLNRLEGRPADEKRWYDDEKELGLEKYREPPDLKKTPLGPGREAYERQVVNNFLSTGAKGDQAVFMAGGPASGKTTLLNSKFATPGTNPPKVEGYVKVDPDAIKGRMPEMLIGVALGIKEAAAITHEQSSRLSKDVLREAKEQGLNFIMDGTGANTAKYVREMNDARSKGYRVDLLMQHVEAQVGVERAVGRADRVGRFVPRDFIQHAYDTLPFSFDTLAAAADRVTLNDSDQNVELVASIAGRTVATAGPAYRQFMRRYPQRRSSTVYSEVTP